MSRERSGNESSAVRDDDLWPELFAFAPHAQLVVDAKDVILEANRAATRLFADDRIDLCGQPLPALIDAEGAACFVELAAAARADGAMQCGELWLTRRQGGRLYVQLSCRALAPASGGRLQVVLADLTSLQEARERLELSELRLRQITEHIEDVFYVVADDGEMRYVSRAYESIWGRPAEKLRGEPKGWRDAVHPDDRSRVDTAWRNFQKGDPFDEEYRIHRPDGSERRVRDRAFAVYDQSRRAGRSIGVVQDVTAERALERELWQAQKLEALGTLAGSMAHDVRNLLHGIASCLTLALRPGVDAERGQTYVDRALTAAKSGVSLTERLSIFSRREPGSRARSIGLDKTIAIALEMVGVLVGKKITVAWEGGAPNARIFADPAELEQIVINLATNARDAMPAGGTLRVSTVEMVLAERGARERGLAQPGRYARLCVQDDGAGMPEDVRRRLFEPFFTTKPTGTGLGLATVFAVVRRLKGHVGVESAPGRGTRFTVLLPCQPEGAAENLTA